MQFAVVVSCECVRCVSVGREERELCNAVQETAVAPQNTKTSYDWNLTDAQKTTPLHNIYSRDTHHWFVVEGKALH